MISFARWSSPVAREAHNFEVVGSNPTYATSSRGGVEGHAGQAGGPVCQAAPISLRHQADEPEAGIKPGPREALPTVV